MKTTMKIMLMLLVTAGLLTFSSCNKEKKLPEKTTVSGQVTYENGDVAEGVAVQVVSSYLLAIPTPVDEPIYTNEDGYYTVEFQPKKDLTYGVDFHITKDGYEYHYLDAVTKWEAEQICDVVLKKTEE